MKVSLGEIVLSLSELRTLAAQPIAAAASFRLDDILRFVEPEMTSYDRALIQLSKRFQGVRQESTAGALAFKFPAKHREAVQRECAALLETVIDIPYEPLKRADIDGAIIASAGLRKLAWLFFESWQFDPDLNGEVAGNRSANGKAAASSSRSTRSRSAPVPHPGTMRTRLAPAIEASNPLEKETVGEVTK